MITSRFAEFGNSAAPGWLLCRDERPEEQKESGQSTRPFACYKGHVRFSVEGIASKAWLFDQDIRDRDESMGQDVEEAARSAGFEP
jgi:hypothetical protein